MRITIFLGLFLSVISTQGQSLSQEEKKAGLTLAWKTAQDQFVYFDQVSVNWDSLYRATLPQVLASKSTKEYYEILIKFYAQLKDGHTWIWYPDSINDQLNTIPIETALIENKIIVTNVLNPELSKRTHRGDEIVTIQGISAIEYGRQFIMPFVSSSTEQDLLLRTYSYDLFLGNMDEDVRLELKRQQDDSIQTINVSRNLEFTETFQSYEFQVLSDNVGYLKINTFYERNYKAIFDSLYSVILPTDGLLIDLRQNGGGSGLQGNYILSHFIESPTLSAKYKTRSGPDGQWEEFPADTIYPQSNKEIYAKPVILLIGSGTYSAAEDFCLAFDQAHRGIKIGTKTSGSTGNSTGFDLPGGGYGQVTIKRDSYVDGKEFVDYGIEPEIEVKITIQDVVEARDAVLLKAIEVLKER